MTKKITELKNPPISTEEFDEWKRNWDNKTPIPDKIHDYMLQVAIPKLSQSLDDWDRLVEGEIRDV
jgi:hypothetical protein